MCNHIYNYPEDKRENYNPDGKTLTGVCKLCGRGDSAFGRREILLIEEKYLKEHPHKEIDYIVRTRILY